MVIPEIDSNHKRQYPVYCPWLTDLEKIFDWNNKGLSFYEYRRLRAKQTTSHICDEKCS